MKTKPPAIPPQILDMMSGMVELVSSPGYRAMAETALAATRPLRDLRAVMPSIPPALVDLGALTMRLSLRGFPTACDSPSIFKEEK